MKNKVEAKLNKERVKKVIIQTPFAKAIGYVVYDNGNDIWLPLDKFLKDHTLTYVLSIMYDVEKEKIWDYFKHTYKYDMLEKFKKYLNPPPSKIILTVEDVKDI